MTVLIFFSIEPAKPTRIAFSILAVPICEQQSDFAETVRAEEINSGTLVTPLPFSREKCH